MRYHNMLKFNFRTNNYIFNNQRNRFQLSIINGKNIKIIININKINLVKRDH